MDEEISAALFWFFILLCVMSYVSEKIKPIILEPLSKFFHIVYVVVGGGIALYFSTVMIISLLIIHSDIYRFLLYGTKEELNKKGLYKYLYILFVCGWVAYVSIMQIFYGFDGLWLGIGSIILFTILGEISNTTLIKKIRNWMTFGIKIPGFK